MCPQLFDIVQAIVLDIAHSGVVKSLPLPKLERGDLFGSIDRYNPVILGDREAAVVSLLKALPKKFTDHVQGESLSEEDRNLAALIKFKEANEKCRETNSRLRSYFAGEFSGSSPLDNFLRGALGEAQRFIHNALTYEDAAGYVTNSVPLRDLFASLRCGPGSSNGAIGDTYVDKCLRGPLTTTREGLYSLYLQALQTAPLLFDHDGNQRSGGPNPAQLEAERARDLAFGHKVIGGSKIAFAPKSWKISRTIATEPSLNMMFQLGLHEQLCFFLARLGLNLPTQQERNRRLARRGSLSGDLFTMDLSSASDSVSIELVRYLFPEDWFSWFMFTRSPTIDIQGDSLELHMLSSMGNGYTFAVETLVFLGLTVGCYTMLGLPVILPNRVRDGNIGVYGDDIIGLTEAFGPLSFLLEHCGFSVNLDKSYSSGPFRESCGGDYFRGHDVRGVYSTTVSTPQDRASLINRLAIWGCKNGVSFNLTSQVLLTGDPFVVVPLYESDDAGVRVPYRVASKLGVTRRARHLSKVIGCDRSTDVYRCYEVHPRRETLLSKDGVPSGFLLLNQQGVLLAALQGALQGRWLTLRSMKTTYKLTFKAAPGWDRTWTGSFPTKGEKEWFRKLESYLYMMYSWLDAG